MASSLHKKSGGSLVDPAVGGCTINWNISGGKWEIVFNAGYLNTQKSGDNMCSDWCIVSEGTLTVAG